MNPTSRTGEREAMGLRGGAAWRAWIQTNTDTRQHEQVLADWCLAEINAALATGDAATWEATADRIGTELVEVRERASRAEALLRRCAPILRARYDSLPAGTQGLYAEIPALEREVYALLSPAPPSPAATWVPKVGDRVRLRVGAPVMQDHSFPTWPHNGYDSATVFTVKSETGPFANNGPSRVSLVARGFGLHGADGSYGNGAIYADAKDCEPAATPAELRAAGIDLEQREANEGSGPLATAPHDLGHAHAAPSSPAAAARPTRPEIVCLCGSTRFIDTFQEEYGRLTDEGKIVLTVGRVVPQSEQALGSARKVALDELHKRKIDLADRVFVLNVGGYVGASTRSEIAYAEAHGKPVTYLEEGVHGNPPPLAATPRPTPKGCCRRAHAAGEPCADHDGEESEADGGLPPYSGEVKPEAPKVGDVVRYIGPSGTCRTEWVLTGKETDEPYYGYWLGREMPSNAEGTLAPSEVVYLRPATEQERVRAGLPVPAPVAGGRAARAEFDEMDAQREADRCLRDWNGGDWEPCDDSLDGSRWNESEVLNIVRACVVAALRRAHASPPARGAVIEEAANVDDSRLSTALQYAEAVTGLPAGDEGDRAYEYRHGHEREDGIPALLRDDGGCRLCAREVRLRDETVAEMDRHWRVEMEAFRAAVLAAIRPATRQAFEQTREHYGRMPGHDEYARYVEQAIRALGTTRGEG